MKTKAIIGFCLGTVLLYSCGQKTEETKKEVVLLPLVKLETAKVERFERTIKAQGNVETEQDVMISTDMGGMITKVHVKAGDNVTAGQVLISLDGSVLSANANEIETQLEYARYMLKKQEELKNRGVGSEFDYETAKNQVKSLQSRLNSLNTQRVKTVVKAPFSGTVDDLMAKLGQMAGPGTPLMRLVNSNTVDITATVSERHFNNVKVGTPLNVSFPNYEFPDMQVKVTKVANYIEPTNRTFKIRSTVTNNKTLLPNMLAEVKITDLIVEDGLVIPAKSILKSSDNRDFVWLAKKQNNGNYSVKKVYIELVAKQDKAALIEKNAEIEDGSLLIVDGARGITEKDLVRSK